MGAMSNERIGRDGSERDKGRMVSIITGLYFIIII